MRLSVIIPLYNDEKCIGECLDAILAADHDSFEVLVVDDCSTDRSAAIAAERPCTVISLDENGGAGNARNQGALRAKGEVLVFIDSDVIVEKDSLSRFDRLHRDEGKRISMCNIYPRSLSAGTAATLTAVHWNYINRGLRDDASFVSTMCCAIDRDVFFDTGMFKPYMAAGGEEFEQGEVIRLMGYKIYVDTSFEVHHYFQNFLARARTLFKRSAIYTVIVAERRFRHDKGHGTPAEAICSLLSVLGVTGLLASFFFPAPGVATFGVSILAQALIQWDLNRYVLQKKGLLFMLRSIPIWWCWYLAMCLGLIKGLFAYASHMARIVLRVPMMLFSKTPNYIILFVTNRCNARCKHCFNKNMDGSNDLSLDEMARISESYGSIKYLTCTGGEPTMRKDIVDIVKTFHRNNNLEFLNLITNGFNTDAVFRTTRDIVRLCKPMFMRLNFSVDGIGEQHDRIRGVPGGFERVVESIRKTRELKQFYPHLDIGAIITFSSYNQDNVIEVIDYVIDELQLPAAMNYVRGDTADPDARRVTLDKYIAASQHLKRKNGQVKGRIRGSVMRSLSHVTLDMVERTVRKDKAQITCLAGRKMLVIKENGDVMPCEMLSETYGNLRDVNYDINVILEKSKAYPGCYCTWECAMQNNLAHTPRFWPRILGEYLKLSFFRQSPPVTTARRDDE